MSKIKYEPHIYTDQIKPITTDGIMEADIFKDGQQIAYLSEDNFPSLLYLKNLYILATSFKSKLISRIYGEVYFTNEQGMHIFHSSPDPIFSPALAAYSDHIERYGRFRSVIEPASTTSFYTDKNDWHLHLDKESYDLLFDLVKRNTADSLEMTADYDMKDPTLKDPTLDNRIYHIKWHTDSFGKDQPPIKQGKVIPSRSSIIGRDVHVNIKSKAFKSSEDK